MDNKGLVVPAEPATHDDENHQALQREKISDKLVEEAAQLARKKAAEISASLLTLKSTEIISDPSPPATSSVAPPSNTVIQFEAPPRKNSLDGPASSFTKRDYFADPPPQKAFSFTEPPPLPAENPPQLPKVSTSDYDKYLTAKVAIIYAFDEIMN